MATHDSDDPSSGNTLSTRPTMIIDCDPGHDDAVAIVTAAHFADVRGIVTVAGNAPIERTTHNALVMRDLLHLDAPVHSGSTRPLVAPPRYGAFIHGESGLDGAELPEPTTPLDGDAGVDFIIETCRSEEGIWLVPMGPLTNIALAFRLAPDLPHRVAGVSLMGGGSFGNRSAVAEFNIWADPEAAAIVFDAFDPAGSGAGTGPLVMAGLDVTYQLQITDERIESTRALVNSTTARSMSPVTRALEPAMIGTCKDRGVNVGRKGQRLGGDLRRITRGRVLNLTRYSGTDI